MAPTDIFGPVVALVGLTFLVLLRVPYVRIRAGLAKRLRPDDFKLGESAQVPPDVAVVNRNFMNLLELPLLFYVVCVCLFVTGHVDRTAIAVAWGYVGLRAAHSLVHLTYNHIFHRLFVFTASTLTLVVLWLRFALAVFSTL